MSLRVSSLLHIYKVFTFSEVRCWSIHEIKAKYFLYMYQKIYFAFPMLHTEQNERMNISFFSIIFVAHIHHLKKVL